MENEEVKPAPVLADSEYIFVQANDFIKAKYKDNMSFWEFMIFGKMCSMIAPDDENFKEYTVYVKDLIQFLGISDGGMVYRYVLEAASRLLERRVIVSYKEDVGRRMVLETNLVTGFAKPEKVIKNEPLFIKLTFHPQLKPFLLELQKDFTKVDLRNYKFLRTGSSIRVYHLLKQYFGRRQYVVEVPLDELKEMIGVSDKYELYGHFKSAILEESQKRLTQTTDISFTYKEVKKGRKVVAVIFSIRENSAGYSTTNTTPLPPKKTIEAPSITLPTVLILEDIELLVCETWQLSAKMWLSLREKYDENTIRTAVRVTQNAITAGKVKDAAGFFVQAVRNDYVDTEAAKVYREAMKEEKKNQLKMTFEQQKETEIAYKTHIDQTRKALFEQQKEAILKILEEDVELLDTVAKRLHSGVLYGTYNDDIGFFENMKNPLLLAAVLNIVKEIKGDSLNKA